MKTIKTIIILACLSIFVSCSSSSDNDEADFFNFTKDGQTMTVTEWVAMRTGNSIAVTGECTDGSKIEVEFNKFGRLKGVKTIPATGSTETEKSSQYNFSSHSFDFELVELDEGPNRIKVNFSGKVYEDENDINSDFSTIEGDFSVIYGIIASPVSLYVRAKINGEEWYASKLKSIDVTTSKSRLEEGSDDAYKIVFFISNDPYATSYMGSPYNFTSANQNQKIVLYKYDIATQDYIQYNCSGSFSIINHFYGGIGKRYINANFNLTATNPVDNSQIIVTDGHISEDYTCAN